MSAPSKNPDPTGKAGWWDALLRSMALWTGIRFGALAAFVLVAWAAWGMYSIPDVSASDPLMYTNLGNLAFWVFWMMGIVVLAPMLGRAWCAFCPLGIVNEWAGRWGLSMRVPRFFQNDYLKSFLLLATVFLLGLSRIHHYPGATAIYLAVWAGLALVAGAMFSGRALCRCFCPVGGLLGMYGRCAPLEVRVRDKNVCDECEGKECVRGSSRHVTLSLLRLRADLRLFRAPCPVGLSVWDMRGSSRCLFCLNCLKACPHGNVALGGRVPLANLWRERFPRFSETALAAAVLGFLLLGYLKFWPALESVLALPVSFATGAVGAWTGRVLYLFWFGFLLPWLVLMAPAAALRAAAAFARPAGGARPAEASSGPAVRFWLAPVLPAPRGGEEGESVIEGVSSVRGLAASFLPALIPVLLSGHFVLALVKINAKASYLPLALSDPGGMRSYMAIEELSILPRPGLLFSMGSMRVAAAAALAAGLVASLAAVFRIARREKTAFLPYALQVLAVAFVMAGGLFKWLF